jgi:hypothetical protein
MSVEEIKRNIAGLSADERRHLAAYLYSLRQADDEEEEEIERAVAKRDPADWMTLDQIKARLKEDGVTDETL